jgi:tetraacyldisaccharide 4'-kinase
MSLPTPRWWYLRGRGAGTLTRLVLQPIALVWAAATARRIARGRRLDPGVPVICVGNLTLGGAGKTPVAAAILRRLTDKGLNAHALSRGHGGSEAGPLRVDRARQTASEVGDEPLMLAQTFPAWIARDRAAGAAAAAGAGAQVVVMDDGHQNASVKKVLSLVVIDGETRDGEWPFGDGSVFPAGPMREPLKTGLARADAVVLLLPADLDAPDPGLIALFGAKPVLIARLEPLAAPPAGPQLGFAGVGKPWKVERALKAAGCDLVEFVPLPDHARLDEDLLRRMARRAADFQAGMVTTEKDWARLPPAWRGRIKPWTVRARFEDDAAIDRLLDQALASARQPMSER